jgi:K(+)-stimulated pyrophosphate-energized sodium pump
LVIALALPGLLWLSRHVGGRARETGRQVATTTQNPIPPPARTDTTTQNTPSSIPTRGVPTGSVSQNLAGFLADGSQTAPQTFVFDHLNFETASTQLTADSQGTVTNLSQTLKAYPNAQVQLSGYADDTGTADANQKLSLDRANTVRQMLVNDGIAADRIATNGYGQERPIASNDTQEGRAENRRLELTVTQK